MEHLLTQVLEAVRTDERKINVFLKLLEENSLGDTAMFIRTKLEMSVNDSGYGVSESCHHDSKATTTRIDIPEASILDIEPSIIVHADKLYTIIGTYPFISQPHLKDIPHSGEMHIGHVHTYKPHPNEMHIGDVHTCTYMYFQSLSEEMHRDTQPHLQRMPTVHAYQETQSYSTGILPGMKNNITDQPIERVGREKSDITDQPIERVHGENPPKSKKSKRNSRKIRKEKEKNRLKRAKLEIEANKRKLIEARKQLEKKDLQILELEEKIKGDLECAPTINTSKEKNKRRLQARLDKQNAKEMSEQNFLREVSSDDVDAGSDQHLDRRVELHVLIEFFVLVLLFVVAPGDVLIGCLSAFVFEIKPTNLLMYVASAVFAFQIPPRELFTAGGTMTIFVASMLNIPEYIRVLKYMALWVLKYMQMYSLMESTRKAKSNPVQQLKWSGISVSTIRLLAIVYVCLALQWGIGWNAAEKAAIRLRSMAFSSTFVHLLPYILLAILTDVMHISFKTCWCILAGIQWFVSLIHLAPVVELRAALVICLITCTILQHLQEAFSQDVITVKNCSVFKYVGSELSFLWRDYGIELHIPAAGDLIDDIDVTVQVRVPDGSFQIPNGFQLVSAIYSISTSRPLPVKAVLRIQHCIPRHKVAASGRLTFVHVHSGPPYEFQQLKGGKFSQKSCYGEIMVSEFSDFGIADEEDNPPDLLVGVYSYGTMAHFVVTRNLAAHLRAVEDELKSKTDKSTIVESDENLKEIELCVPTKSKGWEVTSTFTPAVLSMKVVRSYQPGKAATIPKITLEMEWLRSSEPAKPTDVVIHVRGLEKLKAFKLPCGRESAVPIPPNPSCLTRLKRALKYKIPYSQFSGKLNVDRDFLRVHQLLSNLKKGELRTVGRHLGLSDNTVNNYYYDNSVNNYREEIITAWMNERDNVLKNGGATWENLKKALESEGLNGNAARIQ